MLIRPGQQAPDFALPDESGATTTLGQLTEAGPVLLAFFKTTCGTCKLAFPVVGEMARRFAGQVPAVPVVAVAQDPLDRARAFLDEYGFEGPVLDDHAGSYATSAAYGLDAVPALVLVEPDAKVAASQEGWDRDRYNALGRALAERSGGDASPLSTEADGRPAFKPG